MLLYFLLSTLEVLILLHVSAFPTITFPDDLLRVEFGMEVFVSLMFSFSAIQDTKGLGLVSSKASGDASVPDTK